MGSCNIYHKCQVSCDSPVLCKLVDSPVFSQFILSSRYMWFNMVGENCFERFTGRETYIESIPPTVYICCFPEERTFLVSPTSTCESCSGDSKFWNRTGMLYFSFC
jgi:hypothetical protein